MKRESYERKILRRCNANTPLMHVLQLWKHIRMSVCVSHYKHFIIYVKFPFYYPLLIHKLTASIKRLLLHSVTV